MATLTFLGIENPLGVLGPKVRGVITEKADLKNLESVSKDVVDASRYAVHTPTNKYTNRAAAMPKGVNRLIVEDTINNRDYVLRLLKARKYPKVRVAMCSSLDSLLKYLHAQHLAVAGNAFDTIIVYGHGMPGSINMGLGKIAIGQPKSPGHDRYEDRKGMREAFGLDQKSQGEKPEVRHIRDLNTKNVDVWTGAFAGIANCVRASKETGYFHLFLMGCSVGAEKVGKGGSIELQRCSTQSLSTALGGLDVCVSAPAGSIDDDHLDDLLNNLESFKKGCATGENMYLKGASEDSIQLMSAMT